MNPLEKLKQIDPSEITDERLIKHLKTALSYYSDREDMTDDELETYNRLYETIQTHFQKKKDMAKEEEDAKEKGKEDAKKKEEDAKIKEEEKKNKAKKIDDSISTIQLEHDTTLQDHAIQPEDLPLKIRRKIIMVNMALKKFKKNPDSEAQRNSVIKQSKNISSEINEYLSELKDKKLENKKTEDRAKHLGLPVEATISEIEAKEKELEKGKKNKENLIEKAKLIGLEESATKEEIEAKEKEIETEKQRYDQEGEFSNPILKGIFGV